MSNLRPRISSSIYLLRTIDRRGRALAKRCGVSFGFLIERLLVRLLAEIKAADERGDPDPCIDLLKD